MIKYRSIVLPVLFASLIFLFSCSEKKETNNPQSITFSIDTSLVTNYRSFDDLQFRLRVPNNWTELNSGELQELLTKLEESQDPNLEYDYKPEFLFKDDSTKSVLAFGRVSNYSEVDEYIASVDSLFSDWEIRKGSFTNNNISFTQLLIQKENIILFKLVFKNYNKIIQVDYSLSKKFYADEIKKVESSIGSIKPITN